MRCLIVGATGQIGSFLTTACEERGLTHFGTYCHSPRTDLVPLDLRDQESVSELIAEYEPETVILAAGWSQSITAEERPTECHALTVEGTRNLADAVARMGSKLVLFTSDEVFGECPTARREEDPLQPIGTLAKCQSLAENLVRKILPHHHLIVRTGWVFGGQGGNFVQSLLSRLTDGETIDLATDCHGQPTYGPDLANVVLELLDREETGTFHVVGPDRHTEFTFARLIAHIHGLDADQISPRSRAEIGASGPRPQRVWLDRFKLRSLLGARAIRTTAEGLRAMRAEQTSAQFLPLRAA